MSLITTIGEILVEIMATERGEGFRAPQPLVGPFPSGAPAILHDLDRGLTRLQAVGGYTGDDRPVLLAVVGQNEVVRLKLLVRDVDPDAFVIITNAAEVLGEGFHDERHMQ